MIGLIKDYDETAYREEVDRLAEWCDTNNLLLNAEKTKVLIVDFSCFHLLCVSDV